jgi:hypothetical protein
LILEQLLPAFDHKFLGPVCKKFVELSSVLAKGRRFMDNPSLDFGTLIEELRSRMLTRSENSNDLSNQVFNRIRCSMAMLLEVSPEASMEEIIDRLAAKWHEDGLI